MSNFARKDRRLFGPHELTSEILMVYYFSNIDYTNNTNL